MTTKLEQVLRLVTPKGTSENTQGNKVERWFMNDGSRYIFDTTFCPPPAWQQYDTNQDAWYFGVWCNASTRQTFTYCEGDLVLVTCPTVESYNAELEDMARCYGDPPPAAIGIDADGAVTEYYDTRPEAL